LGSVSLVFKFTSFYFFVSFHSVSVFHSFLHLTYFIIARFYILFIYLFTYCLLFIVVDCIFFTVSVFTVSSVLVKCVNVLVFYTNRYVFVYLFSEKTLKLKNKIKNKTKFVRPTKLQKTF
jgi:hypothetical protein